WRAFSPDTSAGYGHSWSSLMSPTADTVTLITCIAPAWSPAPWRSPQQHRTVVRQLVRQRTTGTLRAVPVGAHANRRLPTPRRAAGTTQAQAPPAHPPLARTLPTRFLPTRLPRRRRP